MDHESARSQKVKRIKIYLITLLAIIATLWIAVGGIYIESSYHYHQHGGSSCTAVELDIIPYSAETRIPGVFTAINNAGPYALTVTSKASLSSEFLSFASTGVRQHLLMERPWRY
jgi:hypothetical protein